MPQNTTHTKRAKVSSDPLEAPISGGRVCDVTRLYKGVPCSSINLGPREAAKRAQEHLAGFIAKVTPEGFNKRLQAAREAYSQ